VLANVGIVQTPREMPRLIKDPERYKTKQCVNWQQFGCCPYKHKCQFAHGVEELRVRAPGAHTLSPTLKERAVTLGRQLGLASELTIPEVIQAAGTRFGLQQRLAELPTLPEKMELLCTAASQALASASAPPRTPAAPPPSPISASPTSSLSPPAPPASPLALSPCVECDDLTGVTCADDEASPFYFNSAGKLEASTARKLDERAQYAPLPRRELSHATEMVRRAVSFILDEPSEGGGGVSWSGLGLGLDGWGAPAPAQPRGGTMMGVGHGRQGPQVAAGAA